MYPQSTPKGNQQFNSIFPKKERDSTPAQTKATRRIVVNGENGIIGNNEDLFMYTRGASRERTLSPNPNKRLCVEESRHIEIISGDRSLDNILPEKAREIIIRHKSFRAETSTNLRARLSALDHQLRDLVNSVAKSRNTIFSSLLQVKNKQELILKDNVDISRNNLIKFAEGVASEQGIDIKDIGIGGSQNYQDVSLHLTQG